MAEPIATHPECQQAVSGLLLDHKLLEKDVHQLSIMSDRLADAVNKIQEMNSNLCALIKMHTEKHEHHIKMAEALDDDISEVEDKLDSLEKVVQSVPKETTEFISLRQKVDSLEKWRWMIVGGAMAVGFLLSVVLEFLTRFGH